MPEMTLIDAVREAMDEELARRKCAHQAVCAI
jgi:hypothetical protein